MHEYILAGWGMPIGEFRPRHLPALDSSDGKAGEMFDLEALAETCKQLNRWTFFVSSNPFNMPGGVSSPPNAQAIF
jgi:hypothetical protein